VKNIFFILKSIVIYAALAVVLSGCSGEGSNDNDPFDFSVEIVDTFLEGMNIGQVLVDQSTGLVWVSVGERNVESGWVYLVNPATDEVIRLDSSVGMPGPALMWDMDFDDAGRIWVASWAHGLAVADADVSEYGNVDSVQIRSFSPGDSGVCMTGDRVRGVCSGPRGLLAVHTDYEGIELFQGTGQISGGSGALPWSGECIHFNIDEDTGIAGGAILQAVVDRSAQGCSGMDDIWIAEKDYGLHQWFDNGTPEETEDDTWIHLDNSDLPGIASVFDLVCLPGGTLAAVCPGVGIYLGGDPSWLLVDWDSGLPDPGNEVYGVTGDNEGRIWAFTGRGIAVLSYNGSVRRTINTSDYLPFDEFRSGDYDESEGTLWAGGRGGLVEIAIIRN
jgi:hypothetical protein